MKHINERYGQPENLLSLTPEEYKELEPFLKALGVRTRTTRWSHEEVIIQADNPYKWWLTINRNIDDALKTTYNCASEAMSDFSISCYKR